MKIPIQRLLVLALLLPTTSVVSLAAKVPGPAACTVQPYDGPFVVGKYPVSDLVYLNRTTGCFRRWKVTLASPYSVRCAFFEIGIDPGTPPDESLLLSKSEVDDYLDAAQVNTWEISADFQQLKLHGFRERINPVGVNQGCD